MTAKHALSLSLRLSVSVRLQPESRSISTVDAVADHDDHALARCGCGALCPFGLVATHKKGVVICSIGTPALICSLGFGPLFCFLIF